MEVYPPSYNRRAIEVEGKWASKNAADSPQFFRTPKPANMPYATWLDRSYFSTHQSGPQWETFRSRKIWSLRVIDPLCLLGVAGVGAFVMYKLFKK